METMKLSLCQKRSRLGHKNKNLKAIEEIIKAHSGADLYVFPEMFLTGYMVRDRVWEMAEGLDGPSVQKAIDIAERYDTHIIFGMPERSEEHRGVIYNSAIIVGADGKAHAYRKTYLANFGPFEEGLYFGHNRGEFPIFNVSGMRIGIEICYDLFFPEITKLYTLSGADMVVCISASPSVTRPFFEKVLPARAIESTVYVAYANVVGTEHNMTFWGGDCVISPRGSELAKGPLFKEAVVVCEVTSHDIDLARRHRPTVRNTRPDILKKLVDAWY